MIWRTIALLLALQILALAGGLAPHCGDDHTVTTEQAGERGSIPSSSAPSDDDCDHCFLCTGAVEEPPASFSIGPAGVADRVGSCAVGDAVELQQTLDLPPKL